MAAEGKGVFEGLSFLVGSWRGEFETYPESYGERAGTTTGRMEAGWGGAGAWLSLEATMELPGVGSYTVATTMAPDARSGGILAFMVNTLGGVALYRGRVEPSGRLVLLGRPSRHQRVSYSPGPDGTLIFFVEESSDGSTWVRHSGATLRR